MKAGLGADGAVECYVTHVVMLSPLTVSTGRPLDANCLNLPLPEWWRCFLRLR